MTANESTGLSRPMIAQYKYSLVQEESNQKRKCRHILLRVAFATFKVASVIVFVVFVVFPLIFKFSYKLQSTVVFLNFVRAPPNADYSNPGKYGLENARNFYLVTNEDIKLGVWQILPENITYNLNATENEHYDRMFENGHDIVIYFHGNAGTRLTDHRVELYKVLRRHFHVIAFDYRSYGDSSNVEPSETALVRDCMFIYEWVSNRTKGNIFVWAHSLGTSLSIHSLSLLQEKGFKSAGIFLEAPFNNMKDEISEFPLAWPFSKLPWFSYTVVEPLQQNGFRFETDKHICQIDSPIIILHAEDDHVVPFKLGRKLFEQALKCRQENQGKITFRRFEGKHRYEHKYICRDPELHNIIRDFISQAVNHQESVS